MEVMALLNRVFIKGLKLAALKPQDFTAYFLKISVTGLWLSPKHQRFSIQDGYLVKCLIIKNCRPCLCSPLSLPYCSFTETDAHIHTHTHTHIGLSWCWLTISSQLRPIGHLSLTPPPAPPNLQLSLNTSCCHNIQLEWTIFMWLFNILKYKELITLSIRGITDLSQKMTVVWFNCVFIIIVVE